jgi:hypothetical protein
MRIYDRAPLPGSSAPTEVLSGTERDRRSRHNFSLRIPSSHSWIYSIRDTLRPPVAVSACVQK